MRIVYRKVNGRSSEIRFASGGYVLALNELEMKGDILPSAESLTDAAVRLSDARIASCTAIDAKAGNVRLRYITSVPGQEGTYLLKEREAQRFRDALYVGTVPAMVQAEVNATGLLAKAAADDILLRRDQWAAKAAQIEEQRLKGKRSVDAATTEAGVASARDAAIAALDLL